MILTDREIRLSIQEGLIEVDPAPGTSAYSSTSLDLTLGADLREFAEPAGGLDTTIDPADPAYRFANIIAKISDLKSIDSANGHRLEPTRLVLGWTRERVHLKSMARVAARVEGKSSLARIGLGIHVTAPTVHAGFDGRIQLEIINHGPLPIRLRTGMSI